MFHTAPVTHKAGACESSQEVMPLVCLLNFIFEMER